MGDEESLQRGNLEGDHAGDHAGNEEGDHAGDHAGDQEGDHAGNEASSHKKEALLYEKLQASRVNYQCFKHEPVFTVAQSRSLDALVPALVASLHIRNLFLRDRKRNFFLLCLPATLALDLKMLARAEVAEKLGIAGRLSFAKSEDLLDKLGVTAGSVNPFAIICDAQREVKIIIDTAIAKCQSLNAHPMRNDRSITLSGAELLSFLAQEKHQAVVFDFAKMAQL